MNNYTFSFISLSAFVCLVCVMSCHIVWQKFKGQCQRWKSVQEES